MPKKIISGKNYIVITRDRKKITVSKPMTYKQAKFIKRFDTSFEQRKGFGARPVSTVRSLKSLKLKLGKTR